MSVKSMAPLQLTHMQQSLFSELTYCLIDLISIQNGPRKAVRSDLAACALAISRSTALTWTISTTRCRLSIFAHSRACDTFTSDPELNKWQDSGLPSILRSITSPVFTQLTLEIDDEVRYPARYFQSHPSTWSLLDQLLVEKVHPVHPSPSLAVCFSVPTPPLVKESHVRVVRTPGRSSWQRLKLGKHSRNFMPLGASTFA
ncbi:hypothetical protein B0H16DRAFT_1720387 [Mycena metata]|uniref:Uncharacterized protein n=1 Tax=Mycena metata TaxID=1033252 RepID=A0AAD7NH22_9AGAR|nr:hypothetical protein B0H16DRAFT_1720387 [Mycena metata]